MNDQPHPIRILDYRPGGISRQDVRQWTRRNWSWIPRTFDRHFLFALLLVLAVVPVRSVLIAQANNEYYDDNYHLSRGMRFIMAWSVPKWRDKAIIRNDPPLGEALSALPLYVSRVRDVVGPILYNQRATTESLLVNIAVFKSVYFVPMAMIAFVWARLLYGVMGGWLALVLLVFEPTFAAHIPTGAIDVLGAEGIFIGCFFVWLYFEKPTLLRLLLVCASVAAALLLKHTALIFPVVIVAYALMWWGVKPRLRKRRLAPSPGTPGEGWGGGDLSSSFKTHPHPLADYRARGPEMARRSVHIVLAIVLIPLLMWSMTLFDRSTPTLPKNWADAHPSIAAKLSHAIPGGVYVGSFISALDHGERGHAAYLFGDTSNAGWWYYFPVVAAYKVPVGYLLVACIAILSVWWKRPTFDEWSLALPALVWSAFIIKSGINIGWRHFLPPYAFMILLAARCVPLRSTGKLPVLRIAPWLFAFVGVAHSLWYHPFYISYINFPRHKAWLDISDSNVDWAQGLRQVRLWIDNHPTDRPISLAWFGRQDVDVNTNEYESKGLYRYIGDAAKIITPDMPPPSNGLLILSSVREAGGYDGLKRFRPLWKVEPTDTIAGGALHVYDLDATPGWADCVHERFHSNPTTQNVHD